jgi:NAD(P)-dependent dehydrogenase (short-subunit alcohol dehydrogenase family)
MQQENMNGQVAIVTGGSRGIGRAAAQILAARGATVVVSSRSAPSDEEPIGAGRIVAYQADSSQPDDLRRLVAATLERFGRIDVLVNNAGSVPYMGPTLDATLDEWDAMFTVNLRGTFALTKEVVNAWMGAHGGTIVSVASVAGLRAGSAGLGVYGVAKAGMIRLTTQLARELGPKGIRVNVVAPGLIETDFSADLWGNPAILERATSTNPSGRIGRPEEVARAIAFLASPEASYLNGDVMVVDGGGLT